jgi:osmotically-inducible protein OsmY
MFDYFHKRNLPAASAARAWGAAGLALLLAHALSGCALSAAYAKCGLHGCPGDAAITAEVRALFDRHAALGAPNLLSVQTLDGVVYLGGILDTDMQRQLAQSVASQPPGVVRVVNSIGLANGR